MKGLEVSGLSKRYGRVQALRNVSFGVAAGEVEAGTIELVLSQPLSRLRYFGTHVLFALAALVVC